MQKRFLVLACLISITIPLTRAFNDWEPYCYEWECITLDPTENIWPKIQWPADEESTIEEEYRNYINPVLEDNVRLSADPSSYALVAKKRISKGDVVITLPETHYVTSKMHVESYKAGYSIDVSTKVTMTTTNHPLQIRSFNNTWSSMIHAFYHKSPLRPFAITMPTDLISPFALVSNEEIDLLKGVIEYDDLTHMRRTWYVIYSESFYQGGRPSFP